VKRVKRADGEGCISSKQRAGLVAGVRRPVDLIRITLNPRGLQKRGERGGGGVSSQDRACGTRKGPMGCVRS